MRETRHLSTWIALLAPLALSTLVYEPITRNYFYADDFLNLYHIVNDSLPQYLVTPNGGHVLLTRNAIFYLMWRLFGTQPEPYYWSVFITHLINVWLLFRVIQILTRSARLGSFGAALWGTSPLSEGTLGWYAVYGHVLVATGLLVILYRAIRAADTETQPSLRTRCLWYVLALAATTSFGTGVAIAMTLPVALMLVLPAQHAGLRRVPPLMPLIVVVPLVYVVLNWTYERLAGAAAFSLTSVPQLVSDWSAIPRYWSHLIAFGLTRLLLGFYFPPWARQGVWYGVLGCFAVTAMLVMRRSERPVRRQFASCTLLLLASYGIVALGRAALLAGLSADIFTILSRYHRYHYVGQLILTIMVCVLIHQMGRGRRAWVGNAVLAAWYGAALITYTVFGSSIDHHVDAREHTHQVLAAIQSSIDAHPPGQAVYITNQEFPPLPLFPSLFPGWAAAFTIFYPDNTVDGRRVYFVEKDERRIQAMKQGRRTAALLAPTP